MHIKVFLKLKKTIKPLSSGEKNPKKPKKTTGLVFFFNPGFFQPCPRSFPFLIKVLGGLKKWFQNKILSQKLSCLKFDLSSNIFFFYSSKAFKFYLLKHKK
jgi:hypothetical protein